MVVVVMVVRVRAAPASSAPPRPAVRSPTSALPAAGSFAAHSSLPRGARSGVSMYPPAWSNMGIHSFHRDRAQMQNARAQFVLSQSTQVHGRNELRPCGAPAGSLREQVTLLSAHTRRKDSSGGVLAAEEPLGPRPAPRPQPAERGRRDQQQVARRQGRLAQQRGARPSRRR